MIKVMPCKYKYMAVSVPVEISGLMSSVFEYHKQIVDVVAEENSCK
jgi:hypothetical protein